MAKEPSWDDIFASQPNSDESTAEAVSTPPVAPATKDASTGTIPAGAPESRRAARERLGVAESRGERRREPAAGESPPKRPRRRLGWLWALISVVAVLGIGATAVYFTFEDQIRSVLGTQEPTDYEGTGTEEVIITITNGQVGGDVAETLVEAGVTKTYSAFYGLLLKNPEVTFHPGSYKVKKEMSAQAALDALVDPANKVSTRVTIPEGTTVAGVLARFADVSESTTVTREDLDAAATDLASFGLPAEAPSLEGYLFPATYAFDPGLTAHDMLQRLVTEMFTHLDALGVAAEDRHRVVTLASLIQREAGSNTDDFYKVSRVILNRLDSGTPLQFDSTAQYGYIWKHGERDENSVFTNEEELNDDNPYNTYVHTGLPIGPIGAPGDVALEAAITPAEGTWLFFVTVNLDTGETKFTTTLAEHNAAVKELGAWCRETKSPNCD